MPRTPRKYTTEFSFDTRAVKPKELKDATEAALYTQADEIELTIIPLLSGQRLLSIKGKLEVIDKCNALLAELFAKHPEWCLIRQNDEAGDEIRLRAYPIVARIEQALRLFITRAMVEFFGHEWWHAAIPASIRENAQSTQGRTKSALPALNLLEYTQFEELIKIITAEVSEWSVDRPILVSDISELITNCNSLEDVLSKIQQKTRKMSLWNDVFARYFVDTAEWDRWKAKLRVVIEERHKIMHHRPMRFGSLRALATIEVELNEALKAARQRLSAPERAQVESNLKAIEEAWAHAAQQELAAQMVERTAPTAKAAQEAADRIAELSKVTDLGQVASWLQLHPNEFGAVFALDQAFQQAKDVIGVSSAIEAHTTSAARALADQMQSLNVTHGVSELLSKMRIEELSRVSSAIEALNLNTARALADQMQSLNIARDMARITDMTTFHAASKAATEPMRHMLEQSSASVEQVRQLNEAIDQATSIDTAKFGPPIPPISKRPKATGKPKDKPSADS